VRFAILLALFLPACSGFGGVPVASRSSAVGSTAHQLNAPGSAVSVIYSFRGPDGSTPEAAVIADGHGNLYGTTVAGGATGPSCPSDGCGTVFELMPQKSGGWKELVLHSFAGSNALYPSNALVFNPSGNLFSATEVGGRAGAAYGLEHRAPGWHYVTLHDFLGGRDGQQPRSSLTYLSGTLYGTTVAGGNGSSGGNGVVYAITGSGQHWKEKIIHRFVNSAYGANPQAGLVSDSAGNFYGTTSYGGNPACPTGCGTVFELSPVGGRWTGKVLHKFDGYDGFDPLATLVFDSHGNLFGSTNQGQGGGCVGAGCGTIFELSQVKNGSWRFSVVHNFSAKQGGGPAGNMVFNASGNLYGSTVIGGNLAACKQQGGCGVVFKLTPLGNGKWTYAVLHAFNNSPDGALPNGGLAENGRGRIFGTTIGGGTYGLGTVFQVKP
jgi:uncharacterized repeat protein (TIGR03803 family)